MCLKIPKVQQLKEITSTNEIIEVDAILGIFKHITINNLTNIYFKNKNYNISVWCALMNLSLQYKNKKITE